MITIQRLILGAVAVAAISCASIALSGDASARGGFGGGRGSGFHGASGLHGGGAFGRGGVHGGGQRMMGGQMRQFGGIMKRPGRPHPKHPHPRHPGHGHGYFAVGLDVGVGVDAACFQLTPYGIVNVCE